MNKLAVSGSVSDEDANIIANILVILLTLDIEVDNETTGLGLELSSKVVRKLLAKYD